MSDLNAQVSAQRWLSGSSPDSKFQRSSNSAFSLVTPTGDPTDTLHSFFAKTPIAQVIPTPPPDVTPPSITFSSFAWSGTLGSTSALPTWTWVLSTGSAAPASLALTAYGSASTPPATVIASISPGSGTLTYTYSGATVASFYYSIEVVATNSAGSATMTTPINRNTPPATIPTVTFASFAWTGTSGGTSAGPRWTWTLSTGSGTPTSLTVYIYGGAVNPPVTPLATPILSPTATTYTFPDPTVNGDYYKISVTASNSAGSSTEMVNIKQNLFNPATVSRPLVTWFKADAYSGSGALINNGTDGTNATLSGTALTTINGLQAINFRNANGYGQFSTKFSGLPSYMSESRSYFAVCKFSAAPTSYGTKSSIVTEATLTSTNPGQTGLQFEGVGGTTQYQFNNLWTSSPGQPLRTGGLSSFSLPMTLPTTYAMIYNTASSGGVPAYMQINSSIPATAFNPQGSGAFINTTTYTPNFLNGGGNSGWAGVPINYWGYMDAFGELLMYDGALTATEASNVINYLRFKWATP